jgi:hypothetical protein
MGGKPGDFGEHAHVVWRTQVGHVTAVAADIREFSWGTIARPSKSPGAPPAARGFSRVALLEPRFPFVGRKVTWSPAAYAYRHIFVRNNKEPICACLAVKP